MKNKGYTLLVGLALALTSCHHAAGTSSPTDSLNTDSAKRDVTQSDTEKVDTLHGGHAQGDGHPRGGMD